MNEDQEIVIHNLNSQNKLFIAMDYLENLSMNILDNDPSKKWKSIAKELSLISQDILKCKKFFSRVFQEMELHAELNYLVKKHGKEKVLEAYKNYTLLESENKKLKQNIKGIE